MQAQGNDYIYFDFQDNPGIVHDWNLLAKQLSDRNFGIGGDGIVLMLPSEEYDVKMRMFNADSSEAEVCGSALRSIGYYFFQKKNQKSIIIETKNNLYSVKNVNGEVSVSFPISPRIQLINEKIQNTQGTFVSLDNPHFVVFQDELDFDKLIDLGKKIEHDKFFPNRTNVDFIKLVNKNEVELFFWERGSGNTLSCGSGTVAACFVAHQKGFINDFVNIAVPGGKLSVEIGLEKIKLTGVVKIVFEGDIQV